jgi:energy-coupling factor transporter ATP-binding protein EcfA2
MEDYLDVLQDSSLTAQSQRLALPSNFRASQGGSGVDSKDSHEVGGDDGDNAGTAENHPLYEKIDSRSLEDLDTTTTTTVVSDEDATMVGGEHGPIFLQAPQRQLPEVDCVLNQATALNVKKQADRGSVGGGGGGNYVHHGVSLLEMEEEKTEPESEEGTRLVTVQEREASEFRRRLQSCLLQRDAEQERLVEIYTRLVSSAAPAREMILLTGPSGSGKTRLARAALQALASQSGGYFLWGKFDPLNLQSPAPYTAFGSAFREFAAAVLNRGEPEAQEVRRAIREALGSEASVLTRMIPGLEPLLLCDGGGQHNDGLSNAGAKGSGGGDRVKEDKSADATQRFQRFVFVFRTFLHAVATPNHPMVLLLDDIHFAVRANATTARVEWSRCFCSPLLPCSP